MEKRIRAVRAASKGTCLIQEMAGGNPVNQVFIMNEREAMDLIIDLGQLFGLQHKADIGVMILDPSRLGVLH